MVTVAQTSENDISTVLGTPRERESRRPVVQDYLLVWIDANADDNDEDWQHTLTQVRSVVHDIHLCTERDAGVQILRNIHADNVFVIVSGYVGQHLVPDIHAIAQLHAIYILCGNKHHHAQWAKKWDKIKGVYTDVKEICQALQATVRQCKQDSTAISFATMTDSTDADDLNRLEPNFMYTQIVTEILLGMTHDQQQAIRDLVAYCRKLYSGNENELNIIDEFERTYRSKSALWWYTRECFTYSLLNRALRTLDADTIINMGFLIRDLHQQIQELHQRQFRSNSGEPFLVYRGQGFMTADFDRLVKNKGGLLSFSNFLSTSKERKVSLSFAVSASTKPDMVGLLFIMSVDPRVSSTPFALIREVSYFDTEDEVLFSMHSIFRVCAITPIENKNRGPLYEVELQLTADDDEQLRALTKRVADETVGDTGWERLGQLLLRIGQYDKAEELYAALLEQTSDENLQGYYYHQLGFVKTNQGDNPTAIRYHEKAREINERILPSNHPSLATTYNNIATVYKNMEQFSKALPLYEKAIEIQQTALPNDHVDLAHSYNNIGGAHHYMGEYSKALSFYEKALQIYRTSLLPNHPALATSYDNIASVCDHLGEPAKALSFGEKALQIRQKTLPPRHPELAASYNNLAWVYYNMQQYSKALSNFQLALDILQHVLPVDHPYLASVKESIERCTKQTTLSA